jgi:uncharacterized membrane protein
MKRIGLGFVFLWFFLGGIAHFALTRLETSIVPRSLPLQLQLVLLAIIAWSAIQWRFGPEVSA